MLRNRIHSAQLTLSAITFGPPADAASSACPIAAPLKLILCDCTWMSINGGIALFFVCGFHGIGISAFAIVVVVFGAVVPVE